MKQLTITSVLSKNYREELETLLFLSPNQGRVSKGILKSIRRFGTPKIICDGDGLRVTVGDYPQVQTLYALEKTLLRTRVVGSVIYLRDRPGNLTVLHIAVAPDYVMARSPSEVPLAVHLFENVHHTARQIKGIKTVTILYGKGLRLRVPL